ncbi:DUF1563 domain-containing protein, partial [Leptospira interrogans]
MIIIGFFLLETLEKV